MLNRLYAQIAETIWLICAILIPLIIALVLCEQSFDLFTSITSYNYTVTTNPEYPNELSISMSIDIDWLQASSLKQVLM